MNDYGKGCILHTSFSIFLVLLALLTHPYYVANGAYPFEEITVLEISELFCWVMVCLLVIGTLYCLGFLISGICCYVVYFVQRAWYLHKLRKPERVYTGDPL